MNFNDYPAELKNEEQKVLNQVISKMDGILEELDQQMKKYVQEAKNADIAVNPDLYFARILAEQGKRDTEENRKKYLKARDELYHTRLLLKFEDEVTSGVDEIKVGLHSCLHGGEHYVVSWKMPLCRHYILDRASTEYDSLVKGKFGRLYRTHYSLLVKNQVKLRFTHVVSAMNMFPGIYSDEDIRELKGKGFFSDAFLDEMINRFDPNKYDPDSAAKIVSDEFLQELLERRSTPEFKNIVFSIQKKQGEIIQAPYQKNMTVQGCAGSGKSMIMLHRLPILLYDHPDNFSTSNLYVITPSQMYIQLAENMRHQLEISDIDMGTIEDYYDYCISKYPGHKAREYGRINWGSKISEETENYVYSSKCVEDIIEFYDSILNKISVSLEKAYAILNINPADKKRDGNTYAQKISGRLLRIQDVLSKNGSVLEKYFTNIRDTVRAFYVLGTVLGNRESEILRDIAKQISWYENEIATAEKELTTLDPEKNAIAIQNRKNIIAVHQERIEELKRDRDLVGSDTEFFLSLLEVAEKIETVIAPFQNLKNEMTQNTPDVIYDVISKVGQLIGGYHMLAWELSRMHDKYEGYVSAISKSVESLKECVEKLQEIKAPYLGFEYYEKIRDERDLLSDSSSKAVMNAYEMVMGKIGIKRTENGNLRAIKCSPYIYLQTLYQYHGIPSGGKESLLAIDEAQGVAPVEIQLLKDINGGKVVFNMYGDIYQHIEGTKGVGSWDEFREIMDFDEYEMQENYRNASQITDYCNRKFGMNMVAINTPGKGVHEITSDAEFQSEMSSQLLGAQRAGLAAILVSNDAEARYLLDRFSYYESKLHDMTDEDFSLHHTRWNIINIDDAKGLEFSSVIALSGRMSRNQRYIAYTRALDDLYVYEGILDTTGFEKKTKKNKEDSESSDTKSSDVQDTMKSQPTKEFADAANETQKPKHAAEKSLKNHTDSEVKKFFEERGLEVIDKRNEGGRLWIIGEKTFIRDAVNEAISKFKISGKYAASKESMNRNGWCTKTDK